MPRKREPDQWQIKYSRQRYEPGPGLVYKKPHVIKCKELHTVLNETHQGMQTQDTVYITLIAMPAITAKTSAPTNAHPKSDREILSGSCVL